MELKHHPDKRMDFQYWSSNCTNMELKQRITGDEGREDTFLLIAPIWN